MGMFAQLAIVAVVVSTHQLPQDYKEHIIGGIAEANCQELENSAAPVPTTNAGRVA